MGLETGTYVNDLVITNPDGATDVKGQGDDHLRLIKSTLKSTFPNATKAFYLPVTEAITGAEGVVAADQNRIFLANANGGAFTVTLPAVATVNSGFSITVIKIDSSANAVTIDGSGAETINGAATIALTQQYQAVELWTNGSGGAWYTDGVRTGDDIVLSGPSPTITLTDTDTGGDVVISGSSTTGSLTLAADTGNEVGTSIILFTIDGSTVGTWSAGGALDVVAGITAGTSDGFTVATAGDITISNAAPFLTLSDTGASATNGLQADNTTGSLTIRADEGAARASSTLLFRIDGAAVGTWAAGGALDIVGGITAGTSDGFTVATSGNVTVTNAAPALQITDTDDGCDTRFVLTAGDLYIDHDFNNEISNDNILLRINGTTVLDVSTAGADVTGTLDVSGAITAGTGNAFTVSASTGNLTITGATPTVTLTDSDTGADHSLVTSGAALRIRVDNGNEEASSELEVVVDGTLVYEYSANGVMESSGSTPALIFHDTDTGGDVQVSGSNGTGSLTLAADTGNEVANSTIVFTVDGSTVGTWAAGGTLSVVGALSAAGGLRTPRADSYTIATGAITITRAGYFNIDTEASAASDDLDTISGGTNGDIIVIRAANGARTVVVKDSTGNIRTAGDFSMDSTDDRITLIFDGTNWAEIGRADAGT